MMINTDTGRMDRRIIIHKRTESDDEIGNQINVWTDFHKCWASVNGVSGREYWQARQQNEEQIVSFKIRYCHKLSELNSYDYRILYNGETYNIQYIDNLFQADSLLIIKAKKEVNCI